MNPTLAIQAYGLHKSYGSVSVLRGIDLEVGAGTVFAMLGPNGAGKTTTVRILSTLLPPDAGSATVAGEDVVVDPASVRRKISLTGQYAAVDELLTGAENMSMMARLAHLPRARRRARTHELLEQFDLLDAKDRQVKTYSGGMRRRLDLAVSLIDRPSVIFLDEPTTGLDPRSRQTMWETVRELVSDGVTVFLTTQYLEEADQLADRIAVIDDGVIAAEGTARELKAKVAGQRLDLTFRDHHTFKAAEEWLREAVVHSDPDLLVLGVDSDASGHDVHTTLAELSTARLEATRIAIHSATLDEVFMRLTGSANDTPTQPRKEQVHG